MSPVSRDSQLYMERHLNMVRLCTMLVRIYRYLYLLSVLASAREAECYN
jgi:hypothetical protein